MALIEADSENVRIAWNWSVEQEQIDRLDRALEGLARFYWRRVRLQEGEVALRAAAQRLVTKDSSGHRLRVGARALAWQAYFGRALGDRERAKELQQQSLALLERPDLASQDTRAERALLYQQMGHAVFMSDYEQARRLFEQSLAHYGALGDRWGVATALDWLGSTAEFQGAYAKARAALEESLEILLTLGDEEGAAWAMGDLAEVAIDQGRFEEAERLARESRARTRGLGDQEVSQVGLLALGTALEHMGKFAQAGSLLKQCLRGFEELGRRGWVASAHAVLSSVKLHLGQYGEARAHAETSLSLARERALPFRVGHALVVRGCVALAEEAYTEAQRLSGEGLAVYRGVKMPADVGWAHAAVAYAARGMGEPAQMRHHLQQAMQAVSDTGAIPPLLWALPAVALLLADGGNVERALELHALASRYGLVARSRWFEDVAGRHIGAAAASLPQDAVAAAKERGRARDLEATAAELLVELEGMAEEGSPASGLVDSSGGRS
jgi:tetratricopeptide (TPR) repeat protein